MRSQVTEDSLDRDFSDADRLGSLATPTLLINDRLYKGMPRDLERIIDELIDK